MQRVVLALILSTSAAFARGTPACHDTAAARRGRITAVREILDSRGNPTVEVEVDTKQGTFELLYPAALPPNI